MSTSQMTHFERKAVFSLSTILSLRMLGLFMVLPILSLYALNLQNATHQLAGLAIGIYGLTQAIAQIPFGFLSDRIGRKPIIAAGLLIFILGSVLAGYADSIYSLIIARALQGAGAVGSTVLAMLADLTTNEKRTKAMAIAGVSIGFSFSLAMMIGPILSKWLTVNILFFISASLGAIALGLLLFYTPKVDITHKNDKVEYISNSKDNLFSANFLRLYIGIFILHALFTITFTELPFRLNHEFGMTASTQWKFYLPSFFLGICTAFYFITKAERNKQIKFYFLFSITCLWLAYILLALNISYFMILLGVTLFFSGFTTLEAFLPSLISKQVAPQQRGTAMGIYSTAQFLGIFIGGILGGMLHNSFWAGSPYVFSVILTSAWFLISVFMQPLESRTT